jgi:hypothetical protein
MLRVGIDADEALLVGPVPSDVGAGDLAPPAGRRRWCSALFLPLLKAKHPILVDYKSAQEELSMEIRGELAQKKQRVRRMKHMRDDEATLSDPFLHLCGC